MERDTKAHPVKHEVRPEARSQRPAGGRPLSFIVQKPDDRRLHYDLRLEFDGVLRSWAVSQGPSLNPAEKRLAVRTEDQPIRSADFFGSIPKPQVGSDADGLWDVGHWHPRGDPREGFKKGLLQFDLEGGRLKGGFALLRLAKAAREKRENWLLVKEGDAYAVSKDEPQQDRSNLSMARNPTQILAADKPLGRAEEAGARLPRFVAPQLATLVASPPEGDEWVHEIKYDGYRAIAAIGGGRVRIYTRSGQDWTDKFAGVARALQKLRVRSALLDGEIVALDEEGRSSFGLLQRGLKGGEVPLTYYVFDLLELDGRDLRKEPLIRRKEILQKLLQSPPEGIAYSGHFVGHGNEIFAKSCRMGLEGVVSKRADKPYLSQRTKSWLKAKCSGNDEFVIGGYRLSNKKGRPFASLLLGEYVGKDLHYRGRVGTGFDAALLKELGERLSRLQRSTSPFVDADREVGRDARWVEPRLVAQIAYTERTADGRLRHPAYLGLRSDKPAKEVQSQPVTTMLKNDAHDDIAGAHLTHPDKVLFAKAGITKAELAEYLVAVSEHMLPHVSGRPLSLVRCPEGTSKECFFQKHTKKGMPSALKSVPVEEDNGKIADYLMLDSAAGLVGVAQIGGLEIHLWGSHWKTLEHPDRLVFDLDPDPSVEFSGVREAARDVRKLLAAANLESFALLTGGKGIHVVVPLDASQSWKDIKAFARGVATKLAESEPDRFVATMSKAKRKGRVFIDWLRNERGATAIAPYSPRAKPQASVATPVSWTELSRIEAANAFTIPSVLRRLKQVKADPWKGYFSVRQRIGRKAAQFFA